MSAQPEEIVLFEDQDSGIFISQLRIVLPGEGGGSFPASTLQRVYPSTDKEPRGCALIGLWVLVLGLVSAFTALIIVSFNQAQDYGTYDWVNRVVVPHGDWHAIRWYSLATLLIIGGAFVFIWGLVGHYRLVTRRRTRHWVSFMLAGGGIYSGSGTYRGFSGGHNYSVQSGTISTSSRREPDYRVWSYDQDWSNRLLSATEKAIIAQGPQPKEC